MYWHRLGDLPYKLALQKICKGNAAALQTLCDERILKVIDDMICIDFLNEQLAEFGNISEINSKNARDGWEKRRLNAAALRSDSEGNAIREEKKREDKKKKEKNSSTAVAVPFVGKVLEAWGEWVKYKTEKRQKLYPTTVKKQIQFLGGRGDPEIIAIIEQSIMKGWTGLFELKTNGHTKTATRTTGPDAIIEPGKDFGINKGFQ